MGYEEGNRLSHPVGDDSPYPEEDKLILNFLKTLRVAFKMATIYKLDHPAFKKTVDDLMNSLAALFRLFSPFTIGFSPNSLFIDGRFWEGEKTIVELARLFHFRKIKRLEIRRDIPASELLRFISRIAQPLQEFIRQGGAHALLRQEKFTHIGLELLDYSQLLRGEGEEIKDIWPYLLMEAVAEEDRDKLDQLAGSFEKMVGKFNSEDLIQNDELHKNFVRFFQHLKETAQEKYSRCAKDFLKSLMKARKIPADSKFENLKLLISDLTEQDLASTLWEEVINNDKFDSLSFSIFTRIIDRDRHNRISTSLRELFHSDDPKNRRPEVEKKIKTLLAGTSGQLLSDIYRQTLSSLLSEISFDQQVSFDHQALRRNYRYILLNLVARESQKEAVLLHLEGIIEEWKTITEEGDLEFLKNFLTVLEEKSGEAACEPAFEKARSSVAKFIEDSILEGASQPELESFLPRLRESIYSPSVYLNKVFSEKMVSSTLIKAYFAFFPAHLPDFLDQVRRQAANSGLLEKTVASLKSVDTPASLTILKKIFLVADPKVKIQALEAMGHLSEFEEGFLFPILNSKDRRLKGEALLLLMRYERTKHVAFAKLFNFPSPYGLRNKKLIGHIHLVEEKNLREARPFLEGLAQRRDFWNRRVRQEAARVLENWGEG